MDRDWDAEWAEIDQEFNDAEAAFQQAQQHGEVLLTDEVSLRYGSAFKRRVAFLAARARAGTGWTDPDDSPAPV